jgi:hypothetical protein
MQPGEKLATIAKVIRSKNAGPFEITFDVMFDDLAAYERVKRSGVINAAEIAAAYRIPPADVLVCVPYDAAMAFKITIRRPVSSGDLGDTDVYGCQQHVPLTAITVPRQG